MKNTTNPDLALLSTLHPCEFEEWRERGQSDRHVLTCAVIRQLPLPEGWTVNGEYGSEFGGFFPVQLRFMPPDEAFCLCVCSPGEISSEWLVVYVSADGGRVRDVLRLTPFDPSRISAVLAAAAQVCLLEYNVTGLADYLAEEINV